MKYEQRKISIINLFKFIDKYKLENNEENKILYNSYRFNFYKF